MKISDYDTAKVAGYLRIDLPDAEDDADAYNLVTMDVTMAMEAAMAYIMGRIGRDEEYVIAQDDLTYPWLALCGEFYESRQKRLSVGQYDNTMILMIIDRHAVNLLPGEAAYVAEQEDG